MREIRTGDWVTVDGYLGLVTLGKAEFDLELGERPRSATEAVSHSDKSQAIIAAVVGKHPIGGPQALVR